MHFQLDEADVERLADAVAARVLKKLTGEATIESTRLVTAKEMWTLLGVSESTFRRRILDGTIPLHRQGRVLKFIPKQVFEAWTAQSVN